MAKLNNWSHLLSKRIELRQRLTPAEAMLWKCLQNSQLEGRKFRRQHSVGPYILDFYCPSEKLCVELDGEVHNGTSAMEYDIERDAFMRGYGIRVIRIENHFVFDDLPNVLAHIASFFRPQP